jgi:hypothetical protein
LRSAPAWASRVNLPPQKKFEAEPPRESARLPIREIVAYFLRLGSLGFGGPVALCGLMEKELVQEKKWLTKE